MVLVCTAGACFGGMSSPAAAPVPDRPFVASTHAAGPSLDDLNALLPAAARGVLSALPVATASAGEEPAGPPVLRELPPAPSSVALVLSALASLGAWQGARSLKRLHLSFTPDWYHADAVQVAHVTPLQLEFDHSALPLCVFDEPVAAPVLAYRLPRERCSRSQTQASLVTASPRGPPPRF